MADPRILITGRGTSGSWKIRGEQLGRAIGATVHAKAPADVIRRADVVVLVKRPEPEILGPIHDAGKFLVWDMVDCWPQPAGNGWNRDQARGWLQTMLGIVRPSLVIGATRRMAADVQEWGNGVPATWLRHHHRPWIERNPICQSVASVGYEGNEAHLGAWAEVLRRQCKKRGWAFVVNPARLSEVDVVVAMREQRGYAPMNWKSNVKLANAQGSGTPIICSRESGYIETSTGSELWADTEEELRDAFTLVQSYDRRKYISASMLSNAPSTELKGVAHHYLELLRSEWSRAQKS